MLLTMVAVMGYALDSVRRFYEDRVTEDLRSRAVLVRHHITSIIHIRAELEPLCRKLGEESETRITVIGADGLVLAESNQDPETMENHSDRPEIKEAYDGRVGSSTRYSATRKQSMKYVAVPVWDAKHKNVVAVVRTSVALTFVEEALGAAYWQIALGCIAATVLFALLGLAISKRISQPLEELRAGAEAFAAGHLNRRLPEDGLAEIGELARTMNQMAAQLDERIRSTTQERNEREAILASMVEGVLAVDRDGKVVGVNQACAGLLGIDPGDAQGRSLHEVVRNADLQNFASRVMGSTAPVEGDVILRGDDAGDRTLRAHGALLRDAGGRDIGAVIVLNDVTRLRRLENIRRDFVANVSHELRTPVTSIKGAVETLQDGAMANPEETERFMAMIVRQSDRLGAIIEDLLSLSRIEQEEGSGIKLSAEPVEPVLRAAVQACEGKAAEKQVGLAVRCPSGLRARINPALLENAVVNLVDNAIKYSEAGKEVHLTAEEGDGEVLLSVADRGCGIERKHLSRLFERFYRVDKARSRKLGGTGLGLAIVKHIAGAHGGRVTVESTPGEGSTFTIHLSAGRRL